LSYCVIPLVSTSAFQLGSFLIGECALSVKAERSMARLAEGSEFMHVAVGTSVNKRTMHLAVRFHQKKQHQEVSQ